LAAIAAGRKIREEVMLSGKKCLSLASRMPWCPRSLSRPYSYTYPATAGLRTARVRQKETLGWGPQFAINMSVAVAVRFIDLRLLPGADGTYVIDQIHPAK
jgi:hypothetical protein